jgi:hypothetical protein
LFCFGNNDLIPLLGGVSALGGRGGFLLHSQYLCRFFEKAAPKFFNARHKTFLGGVGSFSSHEIKELNVLNLFGN